MILTERRGSNHIIAILPNPQPESPEGKEALAKRYNDARREILEKAKGDPYWTTPQILEDDEIGRSPIAIVGTLEEMSNQLRKVDNKTEA